MKRVGITEVGNILLCHCHPGAANVKLGNRGFTKVAEGAWFLQLDPKEEMVDLRKITVDMRELPFKVP